jgi:hypothetical protein
MYTSIRQYKGVASEVAEIAHRVDEQFAEKLAQLPGFVAYELLDCGDGTVFTLSVFEDRESAEASMDIAAGWIREALWDFSLERVAAHTGEVLVNRAERSMLELVHA